MKEKIILRKAKKGDAVGIAKLVKEGLDKRNFQYIGRNKPWNKKKVKEMDENLGKKGGIIFVAEDVNAKKIVGSFSCFYNPEGRLRHCGDCGWSVHPDYQKRGIGTELLKKIMVEAKKQGLKRLEAEMAIRNEGSWKMAKKCGFKIEGKKEKALLTDDGKLIDTYVMGRILK